jgi:hypothetical protein
MKPSLYYLKNVVIDPSVRFYGTMTRHEQLALAINILIPDRFLHDIDRASLQ